MENQIMETAEAIEAEVVEAEVVENQKRYEGLFNCPASDGNFVSALHHMSVEDLQEFHGKLVERDAVENGHKGRIKAVAKAIKARHAMSTEYIAVDAKAEDVKQAEELYSDGRPYELERLENEIKFYQDQAGCALLEMGSRFIRIKAHEEHGRFMQTLENVGMTMRSVQYAMVSARRFLNAKSISHLGATKMIALSVLDDDEIETLEKGGAIKGKTVEDFAEMSTRELRDFARKTKTALQKEKEGRKKDRETREAAITAKEAKINELEQQLRYQQPPTREQVASAGLLQFAAPYTYALADILASIRKARAVLDDVEKVESVDVQMLSEWLLQFSPEMTGIHEQMQAWTDETENASPKKPWSFADIDEALGVNNVQQLD